MSIFRSKKETNLNYSFKSSINREDFIESKFRAMIWNLLDDAINGYTINKLEISIDGRFIKPINNPFQNGLFESKNYNLSTTILNLQEILYCSLFEKFHLALISVDEKNFYFMRCSLDEVNRGFIGNNNTVKIYKSVYINKSIISKDVITKPLNSLYLLYNSLDFAVQNSNKIIFKKEGLINVKDNVSLDMLKEDLKNIGKSDLILIGAGDEFLPFSLDLTKYTSTYDFVCSEIAGILKVPQSKLRGLAPQGMNATGEYDDKSYFDTLEIWRKNHIEPLFDFFGTSYDKNLYTDSQLLDIIVKVAQSSADIEIAGLMDKAKILLDRILPDVK